MRISNGILAAGMVLGAGTLLPAQEPVQKQLVERVAVQYLKELADTMTMFRGRVPRLFAPEVLRVTIDGNNVDKQAMVEPRSVGETMDLARLLGAQRAAPTDTIWCATGGGECHGTRGLQVRLGAPVILGDSAVIVYSFRARGNDERGLVSRANNVALFLKRSGSEWRVTHSLMADTPTLVGVPGPRPPGRGGSGG